MNKQQTSHAPARMPADSSIHRLLIENIQDYAIFFLDSGGYIRTWNKGAERAKGYKAHEIIGQHFSIFYSNEDVAAGKPERELYIAKKFGTIEDEDWRIRKDGTRFWANVVITALHDAHGELVGFAKVTRDLTERKRQEDELRRANNLLIQQQAELRALNDAKDEFVSLASHQLRTPATAVKMILASVLDELFGELDDQLRIVLQKAYDTNERQITLVNNLLRVAQIDSGKVVLHPSPVDISFILSEVIGEQKGTITERGQTITLVADNNLSANVDQQNLQMAIANLVDNASKYSHPGTTITITAGKQKGQIIIIVQDQGVGIAPENLNLLFGKFQRLRNEVTTKTPGSGLGLFWAKKIIELHGGTITVKSELGKGTTFRIRMPGDTTYA